MHFASFILTMRKTCRAVLASALLVVVTGCGAASSGPATAPVTGEVTLDGNPVPNADVAFTPAVESSRASSAQAVTDATGRFEVISQFDGGRTSKPGMQQGKYVVTVTQLEQLQPDATLSRAPKNLLPEKYAVATSSGLAVEVIPNEDNHFVLKLFK